MEPESLNRESFDWVFLMITISLAGMAWIRVSFPKRLEEFSTAFISNRFINQITREENPFLNLSMVMLYITYLINMSIFIYFVNSNYEFNEFLTNGIKSGLIIMVLLFTFDSLKLFFYWYSAFVFKTEPQTSTHVLLLMLNRGALGLILALLNLLIAYSGLNQTLLIITSISLMAGFFVYRLIKSVPAYQKQGSFPLHYFILYICTLEISPLLILGKYFTSV